MSGSLKSRQRRTWFKRLAWILTFIWTLVVCGVLYVDTLALRDVTHELVLVEARINFQKDLAFRLWVASHGGLYVPIDDSTPPNPYLSHVPERDIQTPSGINLTLMNPAYALRQLNEEYAELAGIIGHITSLNLLRPENAPDEWETQALIDLETGVEEITDFTDIDGEPYFRVMQPLYADESCLTCHGHQGYEVGDVRGGISVSIPMESYLATERESYSVHVRTYGILWIIGLAVIQFAGKAMNDSIESTIRSERMEEQNANLKRVDELKSRFIAIASHELRTPLVSIKGYTELIRSGRAGEVPPRIDNLLKTVERNTNYLDRITSELLDQQRLEDGKLVITIEPHDIREIIRDVVAETMPFVSEKNQIFNVDTPESITIDCDRMRITQVLLNLVSNASKYTSDGGSINLVAHEDSDFIRISISDSGIGISDEDKEKLFTPFPEIDHGLSVPSIGLGLSICKGIVELHGGEIWAESEGEGKGTTFVFTLPKRQGVEL